MSESSKKKKGSLDNLEEYISDPPSGGEAGENNLPPTMQSEIEALKATIALQEEKHLRILAEYDNFRKRSQKEKERTYSNVVSETIESFLPVVDNLERASESPECDEGIRMIFKQMNEVLGKYHVKAYGTPGDQFDPNLHNAVVHEDDPEAEENIIAEVFQKGYIMGEKMIRPAMVRTVN